MGIVMSCLSWFMKSLRGIGRRAEDPTMPTDTEAAPEVVGTKTITTVATLPFESNDIRDRDPAPLIVLPNATNIRDVIEVGHPSNDQIPSNTLVFDDNQTSTNEPAPNDTPNDCQLSNDKTLAVSGDHQPLHDQGLPNAQGPDDQLFDERNDVVVEDTESQTGQSTPNMVIPDPRVRASSCGSQDASETPAQIALVEAQLDSIPAYDNVALQPIPPRRPQTPFPNPPVTIYDLIRYVRAESLFSYLPISEVIRARDVSPAMEKVIDHYFLHYVLPRSELKFRMKHFNDRERREEREFEYLLPVIRRVNEDKRFLPHERVVYEPHPQRTIHYYRHGNFEPCYIELHLLEGGTYHFPLVASSDNSPDNTYRRQDRRSVHLLRILKYTKLHQYYRFDTFKNSPVHVFFKDINESDPGKFKLHAISIPLSFLQEAVSRKPDIEG